MPTRLFFELTKEKQTKIIDVGISEFAKYGYMNSSTNRIVQNAGISKGSLFKYFLNKEELFFFILDTVMAEFTESLGKEINNLSTELFQRIIGYSMLEFTWYIHNPEKSKLVIDTFTKSDSEIYQRTVERYMGKGMDIYYRLLNDIDLDNLRWDRQKSPEIMKWFLKGFNEDFLGRVQTDEHSTEHMQNEYVRSLTEYLEILKSGFIK